MFIADAANKAQSPREGTLKWRNAVRSPAPSGRAFRRLFGLARLGAHGLARRCGPDHGRPAGRPGRSLAGLGIRPELRPAGRRELGLFGDHAGGHAADIGNLGTAEPERVAGAGLLLLEPPTSCSTDRRSNQLSYNCIPHARAPKGGSRMGRKLGATPRFGKAAKRLDCSRPEGILRSFAASSGRGPAALPNHPLSSFGQQKARATSPGLFVINTGNDQAAGL